MYDVPVTLLNFRCPDYIKEDIDQICKARRMSRTALINNLFEGVIREWKPHLDRIHNQRQNRPSQRETSETPDVRHSHNLPDFYSTNELEVVDRDW